MTGPSELAAILRGDLAAKADWDLVGRGERLAWEGFLVAMVAAVGGAPIRGEVVPEGREVIPSSQLRGWALRVDERTSVLAISGKG